MASTERKQSTVAFELAALEHVAHPEAVFVQTQGWARSVGIVSDRPTHVITNFARQWGLDYGFTSGPRSLLDSLVRIRSQPEHAADRYILIGTDGIDDDAVGERGWDFLTLDDAAEAGGWELGREAPHEEEESRGWP